MFNCSYKASRKMAERYPLKDEFGHRIDLMSKNQIIAAYRDNDSRNNKDWIARNPEYWERYRENHPDYASRNRQMQEGRNQKLRKVKIANVAVSAPVFTITSGCYRLTPVTAEKIANEAAWIVEITVLSAPYDDLDD